MERKSKDLGKQVEFLTEEQNSRELEISDLKTKLRKREDELKELKSNLNGQISSVYEQY